jgi:general secretion pathway protein G
MIRKQDKTAISGGFTLVEVLVVVVIIGVLAALVVPRVVGRADQARAAAATQDIASIMSALKMYQNDNGRFPTGEQGLQALVTRPTTDPQPNNWRATLDRLPLDPWKRPYQYLNPGIHAEIDIFTLGADGQPGGAEADKDIGSWEL